MKIIMLILVHFLFSFLTVIITRRESGKNIDANDDAYELYGCEFCDQEFTSTTELMDHRDSHVEAQESKYIEDSS